MSEEKTQSGIMAAIGIVLLVALLVGMAVRTAKADETCSECAEREDEYQRRLDELVRLLATQEAAEDSLRVELGDE